MSDVFRLYTGADGETHFETIEAIPVDVTRASFGTMPAGGFGDWHNERRRQFVITLVGVAEITVSDGESRRLPPGSVMLAEDLAGKGHQTRVVGDGACSWMFVALADDVS